MENASKALIMAGEILIAILVLALGVSIVMIMGRFSANMNERIAADTVAEFNQNFTKYEGRIDITAEEIASVINFAKHSNDERELSIDDIGTSNQSVYWVDVSVVGVFKGTDRVFDGYINKAEYENTSAFKSKLNQFIKAYNTTYFYCNVDVSTTQKKPTIIKLPESNKKGIININLTEGDIGYSLNTRDQTKMVTSIQFGITDVKYKNGMTDEEKKAYAFTVRNDARNMYTYTYN